MSLDRVLRSVLIPIGYTYVKEDDTVRVLPFPDEESYADAVAELAAENQASATEAPQFSNPLP
jgi:hypothetical protein